MFESPCVGFKKQNNKKSKPFDICSDKWLLCCVNESVTSSVFDCKNIFLQVWLQDVHLCTVPPLIDAVSNVIVSHCGVFFFFWERWGGGVCFLKILLFPPFFNSFVIFTAFLVWFLRPACMAFIRNCISFCFDKDAKLPPAPFLCFYLALDMEQDKQNQFFDCVSFPV